MGLWYTLRYYGLKCCQFRKWYDCSFFCFINFIWQSIQSWLNIDSHFLQKWKVKKFGRNHIEWGSSHIENVHELQELQSEIKSVVSIKDHLERTDYNQYNKEIYQSFPEVNFYCLSVQIFVKNQATEISFILYQERFSSDEIYFCQKTLSFTGPFSNNFHIRFFLNFQDCFYIQWRIRR